MARRKDPAAVVINYFETAPPEAAAAVLGIVKGIVARRQGTAKAPLAARVTKPAAPTPEDGAAGR